MNELKCVVCLSAYEQVGETTEGEPWLCHVDRDVDDHHIPEPA